MRSNRNRVGAQMAVNSLVLVALFAGALASEASAQSRASAAAESSALPARLSDDDFWRIFSTFSEAGSTFTTDNFTSNEAAVGQVAAVLSARSLKGGAYIGVGPEQNFTYIAVIEPKIAFIVDIRRQAAIQQLMFKAIFELSSTRTEFIERLFAVGVPSRPPLPRDASIHDIWLYYLTAKSDSAVAERNLAAIGNHLTVTHKFDLSASDLASLSLVYGAFVRTGPSINYMTGVAATTRPFRAANFASLTMIVDSTATPRSFLASDKNFEFVKDMHTRNMIIPIVGDFGGTHALRAVATYLRASGTVVAAFYMSNVEQYLFPPPQSSDTWRTFYESVIGMPLDSSSVLIRSSAAGSTPLPTAPFTTQSSDSVARAYVEQWRRPAVTQTPAGAVCPALQYLDAFKSGRVTVYAHASACVR